MEVGILGDNNKTVLSGILPNGNVRSVFQSDMSNMLRPRILVLEGNGQSMGEILVEEQLHEGGIDTSLRSRSAAKAKHARMSSCVKSGKSVRI